MRKYYIDNLRTLCILLLFPYHTCMVYNTFESFYVHGPKIPLLNNFLFFCSPWFMPLMFVLAGISAKLALQKRSAKEFIKERFLKLFIPLIFGIMLVVPAQTYFAERFHNGYTGGYFEQYILYFTKPTDFSGYNGGFTPAHLWFLLYLFVISLLALPMMLWYNKRQNKLDTGKISLPVLLSLAVIPYVMSAILDISGKSLGQFFALFMLGFFILSSDSVINRLEQLRWPLAAFSAILLILMYLVYNLGIWADGFSPLALLLSLGRHMVMWVCILAILGLGKHYLNKQNRCTAYFIGASFPVYIFHQTWLVVAAFYTLRLIDIVVLQVPVIIAASFALSILTYELTKRLSVTRFMFGVKKPSPQKETACNSDKN